MAQPGCPIALQPVKDAKSSFDDARRPGVCVHAEQRRLSKLLKLKTRIVEIHQRVSNLSVHGNLSKIEQNGLPVSRRANAVGLVYHQDLPRRVLGQQP